MSGDRAGGRRSFGPEPAGAAQLDLAAIRRAWPQVKETVKERKITTHAFLLEGKPLELKGDELYIVFPADRSFHRGEMEKEDHRKVLEEALEEVLGVAVRSKNQAGGGPGEWGTRTGGTRGGRTPRRIARRARFERAGESRCVR